MKSFVAVGTVVWVIDPDLETVTLHQPGQDPRTWNVREELDAAPYLPGFRVAVARFFEWE